MEEGWGKRGGRRGGGLGANPDRPSISHRGEEGYRQLLGERLKEVDCKVNNILGG